MRSEIEYNIYVKQPVEHVMSQVEKDAASFNITAEELDRAVFGWVMKRLKATGTEPKWLLSDLKIIEEE